MRRLRNQAAAMLLFGFLLGIRDGNVVLWKDGNQNPEQVYDIPAASLPPADQLQLRRGIRAESREEVWLILENYLP